MKQGTTSPLQLGRATGPIVPAEKFSLVAGRVIATSRGLDNDLTRGGSKADLPHSRLMALVESDAGRGYAVDVTGIELKVGSQRKVMGVLDLRAKHPSFVYLENVETGTVYAPELSAKLPARELFLFPLNMLVGALVAGLTYAHQVSQDFNTLFAALGGALLGGLVQYFAMRIRLKMHRDSSREFLKGIVALARDHGYEMRAKHPERGPLMRTPTERSYL